MRRKRFQKGSLQTRKHGKHRMWVAFWYEDGDRRCRTIGRNSQMSKAEAEVVLSSILRDINSGTSKTTKPVYTFKEFVEDVYLPFCRRSWEESTAGTSEQIISSHLVPEFGKNLLHAIRREDLQDFLDRKAEDMSVNVVAYLRWFLNVIFKLAMSDGLTLNNPAAEFRDSKKVSAKSSDAALTEKEVEKYLGVFDLREKLIARLAIFEGMRPSEILALRWKPIADARIQIQERVYKRVFNTPKNGKTREGAISDGTLKLLEEWCTLALNPSDDGFVFPSEKVITSLSLDNLWRREHAVKVGEGWIGMGSLSGAQEDQRQSLEEGRCRSESRLRSEGPRNR